MTALLGVPSPASEPFDRPGVSVRRARRVAILGDSVSAGVGDAPAGAGWGAHVAATLKAEMINHAASGARVRDVLSRQLEHALAYQPDLALVFVGGNDALRGDFDPPAVAREVGRMLDALTSDGATVVLMLPPPFAADLPVPDWMRRTLVDRVDRARSALSDSTSTIVGAARSRVIVVDSAPLRERCGRAGLHLDRLHPSPLGHRHLALLAVSALAAQGWACDGVCLPVAEAESSWVQATAVAWSSVRYVGRRSFDLLPALVRESTAGTASA